MRLGLILSACTLVALAVPVASRPEAAELPAQAPQGNTVLELFTSQGCSSCPPADALLAELAEKPGIVALSYSVDYWNYLGWHDTLSSAANSDRQREYARARGDGRVYTPQVVVDGLIHVNGSDASAIAQATKDASARLADIRVSVSMHGDGDTLVINVGAAQDKSYTRTATVWLAIAKENGDRLGHARRKSRTQSELPSPGARADAGRHVEGRGDDASASAERPEDHGRRLLDRDGAGRELGTGARRRRVRGRCQRQLIAANPRSARLPRARDRSAQKQTGRQADPFCNLLGN